MAQTWKLPAGRTWRDKLAEVHPNHGKVVPIPPRLRKRFGTGRMLIPDPRKLDAAIRKVRTGRLITQSRLGAVLAREAGADATCPMTTGMFLRVIAEAAEEARRSGRTRITPWWRVVKDDGQLNEKRPGGVVAHAAHLRGEGFSVTEGTGRKAPRVEHFEAALVADGV